VSPASGRVPALEAQLYKEKELYSALGSGRCMHTEFWW